MFICHNWEDLDYNKSFGDFLNNSNTHFGTRQGWNGKKMYIYIDEISVCHPETDIRQSVLVCMMKNAQGHIVQWAPSLEDQYANDWALIPDA
jgi:hypothetical protein